MPEVIKIKTILDDQASSKLKNIKSAIAGAFGAVSVGMIANYTLKVNQMQDAVGKLSIRLGESTEFLSEMRFVAERSGVTITSLNMAIQRANRRIAEFAATGRGEAAPAIKAMNLEIKRADGTLKSFEELLPELAEGFKRLSSQQDRTRLAMKLFDTEGVSMLQILDGGAKGIEDLRKKAQKLGVTIDKNAAEQAAKFNDNLINLQTAAGNLGRELANAVNPALTAFVEKLSAGVQYIKDYNKEATKIEHPEYISLPLIDVPGRPSENLKAISDQLEITVDDMISMEEITGKTKETLTDTTKIVEKLRSDYEIYTSDINILTDAEKKRLQVIKNILRALKEQESFEEARAEALKAEQEIIQKGEAARIQDENKAIFEALKERLDEKAQLETEAFQKELALNKQRDRLKQNELKLQQILADREREIAENRVALAEYVTESLASSFAMFRGESKAAFDAYKFFAVAETVISTYSAAQKAFESQILPFDPTSPGRGAIAAAIAVASGLARVASIMQQEYSPRQFGGPVASGQPVIVGERGREAFVPSQDGTVIPNRFLRELGRPNIINVSAVMDASAFRELLRTGGNRIIENEVSKGRLF